MRKTVFFLVICAVTLWTDSTLLDAYRQEDMRVWAEAIRTSAPSVALLPYEYGYCGYIVAEAKKEGLASLLPEAKQQVQRFKQDILSRRDSLPAGHYEMYMSAVYVYELRLHESFHPVKAMSMAKEATRLSPNDPVVLSYYGTCLFYAPKPFGSKREALGWFEKAEPLFQTPQYAYSWLREANAMYIRQCREKLSR